MTLFMQFTSDVIKNDYFFCSAKEQATNDSDECSQQSAVSQREYRMHCTWTNLVEWYWQVKIEVPEENLPECHELVWDRVRA